MMSVTIELDLDREFPSMPEYARAKVRAFIERLPTLSNRMLVDETSTAIMHAAVMAGSRMNTGEDDAKASACRLEAVRRGNEDLYSRGYNAVLRSQGHSSAVVAVSTPFSVGEPTVDRQVNAVG